MREGPTLGKPVVFAILAGACFAFLYVFEGQAGPGQAAKFLYAFAALCAVIFVVAAGAAFVNWAVYEMAERQREFNRAASETPRVAELKAASTLTEAQAAVVPALAYRAEIGMVPGADEEEPMYFLITPGGNVPMEWVWEFLKESSYTALKPIKRYSDGTPARKYAQLVTRYCVERGFCVPAEGNQPATWINGYSRERVAKSMGLDLRMEE